jgi:DNA-binding transcriptional regulator YiaG
MEAVIAEHGMENMAYVRRLLRQKQPDFSAALELAVLLAEWEQAALEPAGYSSAGERS